MQYISFLPLAFKQNSWFILNSNTSIVHIFFHVEILISTDLIE